jgi:hypothetical protein
MASHDKLTSKRALFNGLRAFATRFSLCLSPARNGSNVPGRAKIFGPFGFDIQAPQSIISRQPASLEPPADESSAAASSSLR